MKSILSTNRQISIRPQPDSPEYAPRPELRIPYGRKHIVKHAVENLGAVADRVPVTDNTKLETVSRVAVETEIKLPFETPVFHPEPAAAEEAAIDRARAALNSQEVAPINDAKKALETEARALLDEFWGL